MCFFDTVLDCSVFAILQRFWTLKKWNLCRRRPRSADDYVPLYHQEVTSQSLPKPTGRDEARAGACFSMERSTRAILVLSKARYLQSGSCETTSIVNLCKSNWRTETWRKSLGWIQYQRSRHPRTADCQVHRWVAVIRPGLHSSWHSARRRGDLRHRAHWMYPCKISHYLCV